MIYKMYKFTLMVDSACFFSPKIISRRTKDYIALKVSD